MSRARSRSFADIYKLDGGVAAAILGKGAKPEAVADNAEPKPAKPPTAPESRPGADLQFVSSPPPPPATALPAPRREPAI